MTYHQNPAVYQILVSVDANGDWIHSVPDISPHQTVPVVQALKAVIKAITEKNPSPDKKS